MRALLVLVLLLLSSSHVYAASLEELFGAAQTAYKAGDYEKAADFFVEAADSMLKGKQTDGARKLLGNAAIAAIKGENHLRAAGIYERMIKMPGATPPEELLKTHKNYIICLGALNKNIIKISAIAAMLQALPKLPPAELYDVYAKLGDAYRAVELYAQAASSYDKAMHFMPPMTSTEVQSRLYTAAGLSLGNLGDFAKAEQYLIKARTLAEQANAPLTLAEADSNLGILHWERADYPQSIELLKKALSTEQSNKLRRNEGVEHNNLGLVEKSLGRIQAAQDYFVQALRIAREVGNKKDEAIALSNKALLYRMSGQLQEARTDYREALKLYEEVKFNEGKAGALMGIGKIAELEDRNMELALNNYTDALKLYTDLEMPRGMAEALLQLGRVYKSSTPAGRTTRDLLFDDEPVTIKLSPEEALVKAGECYTKALELAQKVGAKEMIWAARQGLGYVLMRQNKLEEAFAQYQQAINLVSNMRTNLQSVSLLGEYMAGKEDLYGEGMEVCALLYTKTKQDKYIQQQLQWDETLRNEVQKASAALIPMNFADKKKQELYTDLVRMGKRLEKAEGAVPQVKTIAANASVEAKAENKLMADAAKTQSAEVKKLEGDYAKMLTQWKKDYPADAVMFEANARVDIPKVQKALNPDQILLQYMPLREQLIIVAISSTKVDTYVVKVGIAEIEKVIKEDLLVGYLEGYRDRGSKAAEEEGLKIANQIFSQLYSWLIKPVEHSLQGKKRIYVAASGFIAQVPFVALVSGNDGKAPRFLVEDFEVSNIRPSFMASLTDINEKVSTKKVLAVGDPRNKNLTRGLNPLPGTAKEVRNLFKVLQLEGKGAYTEPKFENDATEQWWRTELMQNSYEVIYFATHGMPFSDTYYSYYVAYPNIQRPKYLKTIESGGESADKAQRSMKIWDAQSEFIKQKLPSFTPLNGFLFMQATDEQDGLLTIKEIYELPDKSFATTKFVVLSACNTAVTFAPKSLMNEEFSAKINAKEVEKELRKSGWVPGADQVSFTDAFMRRNVNNVYGTLWFADDVSSAYIVEDAMKEIYTIDKKQDVIAGYTKALRNYIKEARVNENLLGEGRYIASNPYYWACGAIFGK